MTTGTKIFLAVFAGLIGTMVLYYGVLMPNTQATPAVNPVTRTLPNATTTAPPPQAPVAAEPQNQRDPVADLRSSASVDSTTGFLTESVQNTLGGETGAIYAPLHALAGGNDLQPEGNASADERIEHSSPVANQPVSLNGTATPTGEAATTPVAPAAPPRTTPTPVTPPRQTVEYTVKSGDTMSSIAADWFGDGNKWSLIAKENPLTDPNQLKIGQKLRLPPKDAKPATVKEQTAPGNQPLYTVRSGDTLAKIAREYYSDVAKWKAIYDANRSTIGSDPANLKPGMKLKLPPPSKPASS